MIIFFFLLLLYLFENSFWEISGVSSSSVFGLYTIILVTIGSLVRNSCTNSVKDIPFKDLNGVELLYRLVDAIRLARVQGKYYLVSTNLVIHHKKKILIFNFS